MKILIFIILFNVLNYTGAAAFSPLDLEPRHWLSAQQEITESGGKVSAWGDLSGNGNNATQNSASIQPSLITNDINGLNSLGFINSQMNISGNLINTTNPVNGFTGMFVAKAAISGKGFYCYNYNSSGMGYFTSNRVICLGRILTGPTQTNYNIICWRLVTAQTGNFTFYGNGTQVTSSSSFFNGSTFSLISRSGFGLDGYQAENIFFNRILNDTELNNLGNYFADMYNLTWQNV
jgi:hypothetical protein